MRIALIGYGKMGKEVEKSALARDHIITSLIEADVWIDFSHPEGILDRIHDAIKLNKPYVIGTTGFDIELARQIASEKKEAALFVSANFSLGVNLFLEIVKEACKLLHPFGLYDVAGEEIHHKEKIDSPSGTAKLIVNTVLQNFPEKKKALFNLPNRKLSQDELSFSSQRLGHVPGTHTLVFDSSCDTISLKHEARSREGFALGAVMAAEWLIGKKGFFTMQDLMEDYA